jgi:hypothetical protein
MSVGGPHAELEGYNDAMREQPRWTCKAKRTADPPQDCNWPFCGCDPYANKVIDTIEESGIKVTPLDEWQSIDTAHFMGKKPQ